MCLGRLGCTRVERVVAGCEAVYDNDDEGRLDVAKERDPDRNGAIESRAEEARWRWSWRCSWSTHDDGRPGNSKFLAGRDAAVVKCGRLMRRRSRENGNVATHRQMHTTETNWLGIITVSTTQRSRTSNDFLTCTNYGCTFQSRLPPPSRFGRFFEAGVKPRTCPSQSPCLPHAATCR